MKVYNTLTRQKEEFVPLCSGKVGFYLCGPTVYNNIHIGNARTFLSFDVIRRYLAYSGYEVRFVQNVTDVDDKIINRANEEGRAASEVAAEYTQAFIEVMDALGVAEPTVRPKATEEIPSMIELIACLIAGEHAYEIEGSVYYSVRSFASYGCLSGRKLDDLVAGARVDVDELKRDPFDFALWKAAKPGEPSWPSPWGEGRPGWHIECSAMSERYLGTPFDIHAGGEDLIFPHHENEIAQSEACYHHGFANYWLHGGMLTINKEKMSKSEGNFLLVKDVLEHVRPEALRLLMLQTHYRSPFDYSPERLEEATAALERVEGALDNIAWSVRAAYGNGETPDGCALDMLGSSHSYEEGSNGETPDGGADGSTFCPVEDAISCGAGGSKVLSDARTRFIKFMDDDFNTAGAVAVVFELVSEANRLLAMGNTLAGGGNTAGRGNVAADGGNPAADADNPAAASDDPAVDGGSAAASDEIVLNAQELFALGRAITGFLSVLGIELGGTSGSEDLVAKSDEPALFALAFELANYAGASDVNQALNTILEARTEARNAKDWARADAARDGLATLGLAIEDTAQGPRITHA